jgi:predicted O-methyltransferase YrrM
MLALKNLKYTPLSRYITLPLRIKVCAQYFLPRLTLALKWLAVSREWTNFSLNFSEEGIASMNATVAALLGCQYQQVQQYTQEYLANQALANRLEARRRDSALRHVTDGGAFRGKCMLNYVLTRASRARTVFEAGTAQGLSAVCIAEALRLNARELGVPCHLYTVDLEADRSLYITPQDSDTITQFTGDSVRQIAQVPAPIDLFLHDTVNDAQHTVEQLNALMPRLAPGGVVHSSWFSAAFIDQCALHGLSFLPFTAGVDQHWYPGGRAGLAVRRAAA